MSTLLKDLALFPKLAANPQKYTFNLVTIQYIGTYIEGDNIFKMLCTESLAQLLIYI